MRVLVTGGTGFLGKSLALKLHQLGYEVTITGRNEHIGAELVKEGISFLPARLEDAKRTIQACAGQEMVFHCGAMSSLWGRYRDFYASNVAGTRNVVEGCFTNKVQRLIYVSTPSIYFDYTDRTGIKEAMPLPKETVNPYAATKRLAEQEIDQAFQRGLPVVTVRPRAIFGPGDQAILPRLLQANRQGRLPLINGGQALLDLTYVDNAVDALLKCMSAPSTVLGQKYNITNDEHVRLIDVLQYLFERLGEPMRARKIPYPIAYWIAGLLESMARISRSGQEPLLTRYAVGLLGKSQTLDISAAKKELGYAPAITIKEGIETYAEWCKAQHV